MFGDMANVAPSGVVAVLVVRVDGWMVVVEEGLSFENETAQNHVYHL